ncbi:hypothetical protein VTI74DRAFT_10699 [Chaetomium olivicolor]
MEPLVCHCCSRPFSSAGTLERHRLRCRFRPRGRKKACAECSRSKVRCDQALPTCSRCAVHSLLCTYPHVEKLDASSGTPAFVSPSSLDVTLSLTPASDLSQPRWISGVDQDAHLINPNLFFLDGWERYRDTKWNTEAVSLLGNASDMPENVSTALTAEVDHNPSFLLAQDADGDSFQQLSAYLGKRWKTTEEGLDLIDQRLKGYVDNLAGRQRRPPFIHFQHWHQNGRPSTLNDAVAVAQLYATRTPQSESVLLKAIDSQLLQIQLKIPTNSRADDTETMQAVLFYASMRIYRKGPVAFESADRLSVRSMQHVLSKSLHAMTPHTNVGPSDWESWILDESIRRSFYHLHALDYVSHARQSHPTEICPLLPNAPLPCPAHIWEAPTAEEWARRYREWEEYCGAGGLLRAKDLLCWVRGKEAGRERQMRMWFDTVEPEMSGVVFECLRAQAGLEGVEALL